MISAMRAGAAPQSELQPFDRDGLFADPAKLKALDGQYTSLTIHRTDELPHDPRISHPLLCVHIINASTGRHLLKSEPDRPSSTPHESQPFILPVMTRPHSLRGKSMRLPKWEEEMIIAEEILYLLHPKARDSPPS